MHALLLISRLDETTLDETALAEAATSGADAVVIDLASREAERATARKTAHAALLKLRKMAPALPVHVRIGSPADSDADLDAIMPACPNGILLGETQNGADLQQLSVKLSVREAELGLADGSTGIIATVATSAAGVFELDTLAGRTQRLAGLVCGADDLALAKNLFLLAARAAGVAAIDAASPPDIDDARLRALCEAARRDGFHGKLAANARQLAIIQSVFAKDREPDDTPHRRK